MPYTIETKDGITIENIPDDLAPDSRELKDRVAQIRAQRDAGAVPGDKAIPEPKGFDYGKQIGQDLGAVTRGIAGGLASPVTMIADPLTNLLNLVLPDNMKQLPPSQGLQAFLTQLGVPEAETEAQKIMQSTLQGASGGGAMAAAGKVANLPALAAQPIQQIIGGAGAGAAGQGAAELGAPPEAQLAAGLAGGMLGAGVSGAKVQPSGAVPELVGQAKSTGVPLMTSDVKPPTTFAGKWIQATAEKIPYAGTGGMRATQQEARSDAVRNLLREYGADDASAASDAVMKDLAGKRSADLDKWTKQKTEVIERLAGGQVNTTATTTAIDEQIAKLQSLKTKEVEPVIARLADWKEAIQGQDLSNLELLRKQIGESFKAPELASVRSTGEKALSSIYGAMKQDMGDYIKANGEKTDYTKWMVANKQLSDIAGELKGSALASVLKRGDATPEVVQKMLFSKKPSEVAALYRNLTPEGQANARAAILAKAAEKAGDNVSPDKFANEVRRLGASTGVFFTGDDAKHVEGLIRVLDATKRAGQASVAPPTGVHAVLPAATAGLASFYGGGLEGFLATMATAGGVGGLARVYESKPVRDLLLKIPQTVKGSPEESALFKRLASVTNMQQNAINEIEKKTRKENQ